MDKDKYIKSWQLAAELLLKVKAQELPLKETQKELQSLEPAFRTSLEKDEALPTSGLIEQQRIFRKFVSA